MKNLRPLALLLSTLVAGSAPAAQLGPFADGDLLVRAPDPGTGISGPWSIYRIDPVSGAASLLLGETSYQYNLAGWLAYDSYRDGVLAYTTYGPWGQFVARLLLLRADGSVTNLGFTGDKVSSIAPVGDGHLYLRMDGVLHRMDASNQVAQVLDADGQAIDLPLDHLIYNAATHALIGVPSTSAAVPCSAFQHVTVHRLDLSPDGSSVVGSVLCNAFDIQASVYPIGLDPLPNGNLLLTLAGGSLSSAGRLMEIDPATLAMSTWAVPGFTDLDGGVWAQSLGAAVVLEDGANELRVFGQGDTGTGVLLPVSVPVGGPLTGVSANNAMSDVDIAGPVCGGLAELFGVGLAGTGNAVPQLGAGSCPKIDSVLPLTVSNAVGGGLGFVLMSLGTTSLPAFGGTVYVLPPFLLSLPFVLSGSPGASGVGFSELLLPIPATPSLVGTTVHSQAGMLDAGAASGVSLTPGLRLVIG